MAQNFKEQPIIILIDEIINPDKMLKSLAEHSDSFPANITIIAVVNPRLSYNLPTLPESVLQINLTTPYRSTIAITSLARFLVKSYGLDVPEGEFGSDVEGKKPTVFDFGADEVELKKSLQSRERMGDEATLLYDMDLPFSMKEICESHGKEKGGPWECYNAGNFFGWEAERVVAVTTGLDILEQATRVKIELILKIAKPHYPRVRKNLEAAAEGGLIDVEVIESKNHI